MDWSPGSAGSLFISATPQTSFLSKTVASTSPHQSALAAIFYDDSRRGFKVMPREKSYVLNCRLGVKNSQMKEGRGG